MKKKKLKAKIYILKSEIDDLKNEIKHFNKLRPHWAKGFSSDSVAAQISTSALIEIWDILKVHNQSEAMQTLRDILK